MASGIINLVFKSAMDSSGFSALRAHSKDLTAQMDDLSKAARALGPAFGTVGGLAGKFVGSFLRGGIWEIAANGVRLVGEEFGLFKDKAEEARKESEKVAAAMKRIGEEAAKAADAGRAAFEKELASADALVKKTQTLSALRVREQAAALQSAAARKILDDPSAAGAINQSLSDDLARLNARAAANAALEAVEAAQARVESIESAIAAAERSVGAARSAHAYYTMRNADGDYTQEVEAERAALEERLKTVAALRDKLRLAQDALAVARAQEESARAENRAVNDRLDAALAARNAANEEKEALEEARLAEEAAKKAAEETARVRREEEKARLAAEAEAKKAAQERHAAAVRAARAEMEAARERHEEAQKAARAEAARLENLRDRWNAARAAMEKTVGGPLERATFRDWRRADALQRRADRAQDARTSRARATDAFRARRIESEIARNGGRLLSAGDRRWIAQYRRFMEMQNPRNNPFARAADEAAKKAAAAAESAAQELKTMNKNLQTLMEVK